MECLFHLHTVTLNSSSSLTLTFNLPPLPHPSGWAPSWWGWWRTGVVWSSWLRVEASWCPGCGMWRWRRWWRSSRTKCGRCRRRTRGWNSASLWPNSSSLTRRAGGWRRTATSRLESTLGWRSCEMTLPLLLRLDQKVRHRSFYVEQLTHFKWQKKYYKQIVPPEHCRQN